MKETLIHQAYEIARERYAELGIDTEKVLQQLQDFHLSMHCWQADDVKGFELQAGALDGGLAVTGNYPGAARNIDELRADVLKAKSLIPGSHRLNLHEIYGDFQGKAVDRDEVTVEHFQSWIEWGKEHATPLDFNSTSFAHPKSGNLSLANPNEDIRKFWVEHTKRCRDIADAMGRAQNDPCIMNVWVHDGCKDVSVNHMLYRETLKKSLDEIFAEKKDWMKDCIEGKVFGIGAESCTIGSNDFYLGYCAKKGQYLTLDAGHFHPTEVISDKISTALQFTPGLLLHVSRPVRWDSDHVVIFDDELKAIAEEIVRSGAMDRIHIGLDFFDASINRIAAWVIGARNIEKALLYAMLEPTEMMKKLEVELDYTSRLAWLEELKSMPFEAVWDKYCLECGVPCGISWLKEVKEYEREVLSKR